VPVASGPSAADRIPGAGAGAAPISRSLAPRALAILAVSAAAAAGVASLGSGSAPAGRANPPPVTVPELRSVPAGESAAFAILRRPRRAGDAFAPLHAGAGPLGANPALARSLSEPPGGLSEGSVSVVPADGAVCLRVPFAGGAQWWCQPLAAARRGALVLALRPPGPLRASRQLLVGLVPDGVRAVTVAAGRVRRSVPVRWNVYETQIYAPRRISIVLPGGRAATYVAP